MKIGIVGLPNAGKSTLFNALTASQQAAAENFPFCTIEPNVGMVPVPDPRLEQIAKVAKAGKTIGETVKFVDIAGLVEGASKGEGLGNKFLAHIRETDAVLLVLRFFQDKNVSHCLGDTDPKRDREILEMELILKDLQTCENSLAKTKTQAKSGDREKLDQVAVLESLVEILARGEKANTLEVAESQNAFLKSLNLLTRKPFLFAANLHEDDVANFNAEKNTQAIGLNPNEKLIPISAKIESELALLENEEKAEFLLSMGLQNSGLDNLIAHGREVLNLMTFFTAGEKEARAWTCERNATAPQAAGKIHTDFEKGFIRADCVDCQHFLEHGGWSGAREKGLVQSVGKDHTVSDGQIFLFKFSS